jgi:hypothetical protein
MSGGGVQLKASMVALYSNILSASGRHSSLTRRFTAGSSVRSSRCQRKRLMGGILSGSGADLPEGWGVIAGHGRQIRGDNGGQEECGEKAFQAHDAPLRPVIDPRP